MQFKEKLNIKLDDVEILEKIIFLKKIGISDSNFNKCFEFLAKYCGKEMKLKFLGEESNIKTFIEGDKENNQWIIIIFFAKRNKINLWKKYMSLKLTAIWYLIKIGVFKKILKLESNN